MLSKYHWTKIIGSGFGSGWLPIAPGTWGTGVGLLFLLPFWGWGGIALAPWLLIVSVLALLIGVRAAAKVEPEWGDDPPQFVWDEVVGAWLTMVASPVDFWHLTAAFFLFRFFDIFKPFGIRRLESLPNGWGVMLDDVAAGIAANAVMWLGFAVFS